jgi:hypothetical protein
MITLLLSFWLLFGVSKYCCWVRYHFIMCSGYSTQELALLTTSDQSFNLAYSFQISKTSFDGLAIDLVDRSAHVRPKLLINGLMKIGMQKGRVGWWQLRSGFASEMRVVGCLLAPCPRRVLNSHLAVMGSDW